MPLAQRLGKGRLNENCIYGLYMASAILQRLGITVLHLTDRWCHASVACYFLVLVSWLP